MPLKLTPEIIRAAIDGFENQKKQIDAQIAELRGLLDGNAPATGTTPEAVPRKRKKFSSAAIKRMREAQKRRWAKVRRESEPAQVPASPAKSKRKFSPQAKARLVANLRKARAAKAAKAKAAGGKKTVKAKKSAPRKTTPKKTAPTDTATTAQAE